MLNISVFVMTKQAAGFYQIIKRSFPSHYHKPQAFQMESIGKPLFQHEIRSTALMFWAIRQNLRYGN